MKTTKFFLLAILTLFIATTANSQTDSSRQVPVFGLGIHTEQFKINDLTDEYYVPITKFLFNINIKNRIRLEPELGFNFGVNHNDNTNWGAGIGVFYMKQKKKLNLYGGIRFEYNKMKKEVDSQYNNYTTREAEKTIVGPSIGGEYFLGEHFSVGGELGIKLNYLFTTLDPGGLSDSDSFISTDTGLLLRFYF